MTELQGFIASRTPPGWETRPLWSLFRRRKLTGYADEELLSVYRDYGVIPKSSRDDNHNKESDDLSGYQLVTEGSLVTNKMKAWQGSIAISRYRGIVSPAYYVYEPLSAECDQFLHYLLRSEPYIALYGRISKGVRVNQWDLEHEALRNVPVMLPRLDTQKAIADFLDRETARIDQLIEKKQRLVTVVMERKADFILSAVTRGLDTNTQFAPSGLDWAPELPSHWKPTRLKHLGQAIIGLTYSPEDLTSEGQGMPVLRANNIQDGRLVSSGLVFVSKEVSKKLTLRDGDILICSRNGSRNLIGKNARVSDEFSGMTFGAFNTVFRSKYSDFIYWALQSPIFSFQAGAYLTSTINQLTVTTLGNLVVPLPPREEQEAICTHIEDKIPTFDGILDQVRTSIDRLKEFRATLITAAVTGQIDVATWGKQGQTDRRLDEIEEAMQA